MQYLKPSQLTIGHKILFYDLQPFSINVYNVIRVTNNIKSSSWQLSIL